MKYYVTICIAGTKDDEDCYNTLEEAMNVRAERDKDSMAKGHEEGFWIVVDENGKEQAWK